MRLNISVILSERRKEQETEQKQRERKDYVERIYHIERKRLFLSPSDPDIKFEIEDDDSASCKLISCSFAFDLLSRPDAF